MDFRVRKRLLEFFLFVIFNFALVLLINHLLTLYVLNAAYSDTINYVGSYPAGDKLIVAFGDSTIQHSMNPAYLGKSANLATLGGSYVQTYYKLKTLRKYGIIEPDVVILPLTVVRLMLNYSSEEETTPWYVWDTFIDYPDLLLNTGDYTLAYKILEGTFPLRGEGNAIMSSFLDFDTRRVNSFRVTANDGLPYFPTHSRLSSSNKVKRYVSSHRSQLIDGVHLKYLYVLVDYCGQNNITVVFITPPTYVEYYFNADNEYGVTSLDEYYAYILEPLSDKENVHYYDFSNIFSNNKEYMWDLIHTSDMGSKATSELLYDNLKRDGVI
ncbi:MAG: hypothetical protein KKD39_06685 [Candidatus Altiarchaeota archaeon]|nr:hypothetical protein [Candidatus Altiarchaeota archaeon]